MPVKHPKPSIMSKLPFSRIPTIATLFIGIAVLLTTACEKETITIQENAAPSSTVLAEHDKYPASLNEPKENFKFWIAMADCIRSGRTYQVGIDAPEDYTYVWTFNGQHAGHGRLSPECLCDGNATVYVTRSRDGLTLSRAMDLPDCPLDNE